MEAFYGGAAGGGKSDALLMAALQYVDVPGYTALLLRKNWKQLSEPGAIMHRLGKWLRGTEAVSRQGGKRWIFPSTAEIVFGHAQNPGDVEQYASAEYQFIGIDELSRGWREDDYRFLFSRLRGPAIPCPNCGVGLKRSGGRWVHSSAVCQTCAGDILLNADGEWEHDPRSDSPGNASPEFCQILPVREPCDRPRADKRVLLEYGAARDGTRLFDVPLRMRVSSNPGGSGHAWVKRRFVDRGTRVRGAVMVPAKLEDNPSLDYGDYVRSLSHLTPIELERLLRGDWESTDAGKFFRREWFSYVEQVPRGLRYVRYWDFASSKPKPGKDPDYTVGTLIGYGPTEPDPTTGLVHPHAGETFVVDVVRLRDTPGEVLRVVKQTAVQDGVETIIGMEKVGSDGAHNEAHYKRALPSFAVIGEQPAESKTARARVLSIQAQDEDAMVHVLAGRPWLNEWLDELELFPDGEHDDQVDSLTGAHRMATGEGQVQKGRAFRLLG